MRTPSPCRARPLIVSSPAGTHRSVWLASASVVAAASTPPCAVFASSHSREARFTTSPMTVYSKRSGVPTNPAMTWPLATPMPAASRSSSRANSRGNAAAVRRARSAWSGWSWGAPNRHKAASPSNLLISYPPAASSTTATNVRRPVEHRDEPLGLVGLGEPGCSRAGPPAPTISCSTHQAQPPVMARSASLAGHGGSRRTAPKGLPLSGCRRPCC